MNFTVHILSSFWVTISKFGQAQQEKIRSEISVKPLNFYCLFYRFKDFSVARSHSVMNVILGDYK